MRHILRTIIISLFLFSAASAFADDRSMSDTKRISEKLERTRQLREETPVPTEASSAAKAVQDSEITSSGMRMVQSLGLLVAMVLIGAWAYRKFVLKETVQVSRKIKLIEKIPLSPRASLMLAEIDGTTVLVGLAADAITLMKLDKPHAPFAVTLEEEYKGD